MLLLIVLCKMARFFHPVFEFPPKRIKSVDESGVVFTVKDYKTGEYNKEISLTLDEFLSRMMLHVLPGRFQKIRYYGFLNNRYKSANLKIIFKLQGRQRSKARFKGLSKPEIIKLAFGKNLFICPCCGKETLKPAGRTFPRME